MKGLPNQVGPATKTPLKSKGWIKRVSAGTGALARPNHGEISAAFGALMITKKDPEIEILDLLPEVSNFGLHMMNTFEQRTPCVIYIGK